MRNCYERVESLCHSLDRPLLLYAALLSQWRYSLATDKLTVAMEIAKRVYSLADGLHDAALMVGAYRALATTLFFKGDFELGLQHARQWHSDLARGRNTVSGRRSSCTCDSLFVLWGCLRVDARRDCFLSSDDDGGAVIG